MSELVYKAPREVELRGSAQPEPHGPLDVVVSIEAVGICGTDLGIVSGTYPAARPPVVLGHEASGTVRGVGSAVTDLRPGDRVVIDPTYSCGHCRMCTTGRPNHCLRKEGTERGVSADGAFRPFYLAERRFIHRFSEQLDFAAAALTEPLSCALTGVAQVNPRTDASAAVIGAGPMGLLYSHALATRGVVGSLVEPSRARRELAEATMPARWRIVENLDRVVEQTPHGHVAELGIDLIVDTSGRAVEPALQRLARGGQVLAVGLGGGAIAVDPGVFADESKRIVGSIDSLDGSFAAALDLIESGRLPANAIVSHTFALSEYRQAFGELGIDLRRRRRMAPGAALKVVLKP